MAAGTAPRLARRCQELRLISDAQTAALEFSPSREQLRWSSETPSLLGRLLRIEPGLGTGQALCRPHE